MPNPIFLPIFPLTHYLFTAHDSTMAKTLQDRLKQRRSSNFVGREQQLELFRQNLRRSLDSEDYYFIFSVHGQGGVGKTTLLKKYRSLAKEADALTAYTNEETKSIPEVLARFAQQLKEQDAELSDFDKRYKVYLQEKKRLEADPEAPKGAWKLGGRIVARSSKTLAKEFIPGFGLVLDGLDADAIGDQMGEWASFVKKRLTNKDEVQLLLQPVKALTPLFLKGLEKHAKNHRICLCFDTYEETDLYLDEWLRKLLEGQYGDAPENLLFVIAGREPLNPNAWSDYGDFIATIPLEAFSELEAKTYLERKGITDEAVMDSILGLSGRLPVLLATLAEAAKHATGDLTDPCATAVERFLKWIDDPVQRDLALHAALPRKLNQDIIQCLLPEGADAKALFQWLSTQPFVQKHQGGYWVYHSVVRELMLRYQFQLSQNNWSVLHDQLANFYDKRAGNLGLVYWTKQFSNEEWLSHTIEKNYHLLSKNYDREIRDIAANLVKVLSFGSNQQIRSWSQSIFEAGRLSGNIYEGEVFLRGVDAFVREETEGTLEMYTLISTNFIPKSDSTRNLVLFRKGVVELQTSNYKLAIQTLQEAILYKPDDSFSLALLGIAFAKLEQPEKGCEYLIRSLEINPDYLRGYLDLAIILRNQKKYDEAIAWFKKANELDPQNHRAWIELGTTYLLKEDPDTAISMLEKGIAIESDSANGYLMLGKALQDKNKIDEAMKAYQVAMNLNTDYKDICYNNIGSIHLTRRNWKEASKYFRKAIEVNPKLPISYLNLGYTLKKKRKYEEAVDLVTADRQFDEEYSYLSSILHGNICLALGEYDEAQVLLQRTLNHEIGNYYHFLLRAPFLLIEGQKAEAMNQYRLSRDNFKEKTYFFQEVVDEYDYLNLAQYNIPKTEYFTLIQQLKDEINYTE